MFDAIVREGSLRGAATALGVKPSTVSHQLKNLETLLDTTLFIRTTRSISMTDAGRALARNTGPAFDQLGEGLNSAQTAGQSARGALKLAVPEFAYFLLIENKLAEFQSRYPEIELEISLTDALSDILDEEFHAGFRLGGMVAQDMVAIALSAPLLATVVASPTYLETHGIPKTPSDLLDHNCLQYRFHSSGQIAPWTFRGEDGAYPVRVRGNLIANSLPVTVDMARRGQGLAYGFREYCLEAIETGELVEVLTEYQAPLPGIHLYFPREYRRMTPLRLFIQHLKEGK
ncbi:LysR family transcriptional regulator [Shimia sp. MIT1388]|uniref:LysR family transcriptional regulator n=1 Tax=Shimia sp. MIT1388 TaxID=3096992 RepID=UPI00399B325A